MELTSCARSIVIAAGWYVPFAARNESLDSSSGHVILSAKNNGGVTANVMRHWFAAEVQVNRQEGYFGGTDGTGGQER